MKMDPYLFFNGRCEEALAFYEQCLSGTTVFRMHYGDAPDGQQGDPAMRDKIMHASFEFAGGRIMVSDAPPDRYRKPQGSSLAILADSVTEAERIFTALGEGGTIHMPLQETFWADRFGMLSDRFDIEWMVSASKPTA